MIEDTNLLFDCLLMLRHAYIFHPNQSTNLYTVYVYKNNVGAFFDNGKQLRVSFLRREPTREFLQETSGKRMISYHFTFPS
jgi:hypothetical protein